jgi:two-component system response regulator DevR
MCTDAAPGAAPQPPDDQLRLRLQGWRLLVGNPSPAYGAILRSNLALPGRAVPAPEMVGIATSVAALRQLMPAQTGDLLLLTTGHLQDGSCVPLLQELLAWPDPPQLLVVLGVEEPALPLAPLLEAPAVRLVWEGNIGQGIILRALEHLQRGEPFVDAEARARIEQAVAIAGALTGRERQVLALVAEGLTNRQIAEQIVVAEVTARDHVQRILRKLAVPDRTAAAVLALRLGLLN